MKTNKSIPKYAKDIVSGVFVLFFGLGVLALCALIFWILLHLITL